MIRRGGRDAPKARNLARPVATRFVGDPAGEALTEGVLRGVTPSLAGRAGFVLVGDESSAERAWHGANATTPQPALAARQFTLPQGTPAVYLNGPHDIGATISAQGGQVFADARYRALAARMLRQGT